MFGLSPVISIEQKTLDEQSALDRRHDDRHRELSESALRDDRRAALSAHRRADAEPDVEPDSRSDPVAARRHRDRAAGAGVQGLRRRARLRLHRGAQEGLPAADHRRQSRSTSPTRSTRVSDGRIGGRIRGGAADVTTCDAVVDRFVVSRKHEKAIKAGIAARCWSATGCCRSTSCKGAEQGGGGAVLQGPVQPDASFRLRRHRARVLRLQQPRERLPDVRRPRRRQAHASGAARPRSAAQHPRRLLRPRGVQVQPGHLGRADDVQPVAGARLLARRAVERAARDGRGNAILYGIDRRKIAIADAARGEGADATIRRDGRSASAASPGGSSATTAGTGSAAKPTRGWRRGSTR